MSAMQLAAKYSLDLIPSLLSAGAPICASDVQILLSTMEQTPHMLADWIHEILAVAATRNLDGETRALFNQLSIMVPLQDTTLSSVQGSASVPLPPLWKEDQNWNTLRRAVEYSNVEAAKALLKQRVLNVKQTLNEKHYNVTGASLLHLAAASGSRELITYLLDNGADPKQSADDGRTPLHFAAYDITGLNANLLLEKGCTMAELDSNRWSPWHFATSHCNLKMIEALANYDPDHVLSLASKAKHGVTPMHVFSSYEGRAPKPKLHLPTIQPPFPQPLPPGIIPEAQEGRESRCLNSLRVLLRLGGNLSLTSDDGSTVLHFWSVCGVFAFLLSQARDLLLDQGLDVSAVRNDGATVLHLLTAPKPFSLTENLAESIKLLFPNQVPVPMGKHGRHPIHEACSSIDRFSIPVYSAFVSLGMDPMLPDGKGKPCFELALEAVEHSLAVRSPPWQRLEEAAKFLHFVVGEMSNDDAATLRRFSARIFRFGCRMNRDWVISPFLEMGFDVDLRDPNGILGSGLEYACRYSRRDIAGLILAHSAADLQSVVSRGWGLLSLACAQKSSDDLTLKLLLDGGLDPNMTSSPIGQTPLMVAASAGNHQQVRLLLDRDADPNATTSLSKFNATYFACKGGHQAVFDLFIERFPQTATHLIPWDDWHTATHLIPWYDRNDMDEINILHYAASRGLNYFVERIICSGVIPDIDCASKLGFTALYAAAFANEASIFKFLIQKGADINKITSEGDSAIHLAAAEGYDLIIDILLEENYVADGVNLDSETPYLIATISGHRGIAGKISAYISQKGSSLQKLTHLYS